MQDWKHNENWDENEGREPTPEEAATFFAVDAMAEEIKELIFTNRGDLDAAIYAVRRLAEDLEREKAQIASDMAKFLP
jgi:hypothetical protein